ncbi:MAG: HD domain-containing phosphohydrolase [Myxococcaceae bacterium]
MAKRLGERLIEAGLITGDALEKALQQQRITGHKLGDCLVEIGLLHETTLLRFLAAEFKTRFVSAEKLSQVKIPTEVLDRLPVRMAEQQLVIPIACDPERKVLSVVMTEPQNVSLVKEISLVAGMDEVYAFIGLRSAVVAGIRKHYYGDPTAFQQLDPSRPSRSDLAVMTRAWEGSKVDAGSAPALKLETGERLRRPTIGRTSPRSGGLGDNDYVETLQILVGMLEHQREYLRGHSNLLARHAQQVARRLGIPPREISHITVAAYLHDLGKPSERHFTLASNAVRPEWKQEAKEHFRAPVKLFETVHLPVQVNGILAQLYEAWDGSGIPQTVRGEEIAAGARVLAAVDAYLDLMRNPENGYGRLFTRDEALEHMRSEAGKLYDPAVVAVLEKLHSGELLRQRVVNDGRIILVAESDGPTREQLVEALTRAGLVAHGVSSLEGVVESVLRGESDMLVMGLRFGLPDLLSVSQDLRSEPECAGMPLIALGEPSAHDKETLLQYGMTAVIPLPLDVERATQTLVQFQQDRAHTGGPARTVTGTFDELSPQEVLSELARARKSGRLTIQQDGTDAFLQLEGGRVVYVVGAGQTTEESVMEIASLADGDFTWDPNAILTELPNVDANLDVVLHKLRMPPAQQAEG